MANLVTFMQTPNVSLSYFSQVFLDPDGDQIRLASTSELYDLTLVQTDLLKAISDPHYFTERVHICLANYERTLQQ